MKTKKFSEDSILAYFNSDLSCFASSFLISLKSNIEKTREKNNVFCLKQIIETIIARNLETLLTCLDLQKVCNRVQVTRISRVLEQSNITLIYIAALQELYK